MSKCDIDYSNEKVPIWQSRSTCWVSSGEQGGQQWKDERLGRIQASYISKVCGRTNYGPNFIEESPEELAQNICGLKEESFKPEQELAMQDGVFYEPYVREWFSEKVLHRSIKKVGLAVWKKDPVFGASLDGETKNDENLDAAIEIKVPEKLNRKYIEIVQSWSKGLCNPHPDSYIFKSHYDQITAGSVITGKHGCYYIVACIKGAICFHQYIETDYDLWNTILYPKAKVFHEKYVVPLLKKRNIKIIMPHDVS